MVRDVDGQAQPVSSTAMHDVVLVHDTELRYAVRPATDTGADHACPFHVNACPLPPRLPTDMQNVAVTQETEPPTYWYDGGLHV